MTSHIFLHFGPFECYAFIDLFEPTLIDKSRIRMIGPINSSCV